MKPASRKLYCIHAIGTIAAFVTFPLYAADPLPSWNDTDSKRAIIGFVERVTDEDSQDYVEPAERIATFDNDGTLWSEKPFYFQLAFALDRVKAMAPQHPEWQDKQPFKGVLEGDLKAVMAGGKKSLMEIICIATITFPAERQLEFPDSVGATTIATPLISGGCDGHGRTSAEAAPVASTR